MTRIPWDSLEPQTLARLIEEFVTREGAVHGHVDTGIREMSAAVLRQLKSGDAVIIFDEAGESADILLKKNLPPEDRRTIVEE